MIENTALILEGGGFRGMFTAGVLEEFMKNDLYFETVYGVSAGASYAASYLSRQQGRNLEVNEFINDKRYLSFNNLLHGKPLFSWDFIFEEIPQNIIPFDYETLQKSPSRFFVGASNCLTGEAEFFLLNEADKKEFKTILSASCSLPLISPVVSYKGKHLLDGGLADSIPYESALKNGSKRAVVVLTQPKDYRKQPIKNGTIFKWYYRKYPKVYEMLRQRADNYNASLRRLNQLEKEGIVYIIRPNAPLQIKRTENNPLKTGKIFLEGEKEAQQQWKNLERWLRH